jgi:ATP-dependent helicase Lhr and Lhr-like helicase
VDDPLAPFSPATRAWFGASFPAATTAQTLGWPSISSGAHTLIHAPTGSGKTLAAFLWTLDRLLTEPMPERGQRCRVLYVSPLKALAYDIDRNLRAPLLGIRHASERLGTEPLPELTTFLRTGDTPAEDRRRMQKTPPDILITTPESLYLLLTSQAREVLTSVRWVIVDEVHAVAGSKRGAHLAVSLERLHELAHTPPQRIGLSATQRPLETIARFLGGFEPGDDDVMVPRPVGIVDAGGDRPLDIELVVPVEDMTEPAPPDPLEAFLDGPEATPRTRSIWPAVYPRILELINTHTSTIVFANSRRLAERMCAELNALAGSEIARAHHGSVSRDQRVQIEESLKRGELAAVVATSSLELGIDMGAVDLVIQVEAPISVASGLQRVGRAGHHVGGISTAKVFPKYRGDLLLSAVLVDLMERRQVEATAIPRNPLDVLSQQLVASTVIEDRSADDLYAMARRAAPYAELTRPVFDATLDMLAGRYPSDLFAELRPRLTWDRVGGTVTARPGARQLAVANAGTIPDRGLYRVQLPDGGRVGELDEEMVYESREGDVFLLGSSSWRITEIGPDRVVVVPAPGVPGAKMPFWHGDALGRSIETGRAVGGFIRHLADLDAGAAVRWLTEERRLDALAASNLIQYVTEQLEVSGAVPTDRTIVVERFRDEIGDWRMVILSPLGARVHAPWAMAMTQRLRERSGTDVDVIWSDDGIALRFPDTDDIPGFADLAIEADEIEAILVDHLPDTSLFAARFREAAGRALLLPRRRPGRRTPLWMQRRRAADLLGVAKQFGSFPIVLETYREVLQDDFDLPALKSVLSDVAARRVRVVEVETRGPSPFASSLLFAFVAAFLYEADTPLAERRAAALTLDRDLLAELLGEGELRELLSPDVLTNIELELQHLAEDRRVRHPDAVADLLRDLGPLTTEAVTARSADLEAATVLAELEAARRVIRVMVAGTQRWAAIEDAGRLRDAQGVQPPRGVPHVFLEPVVDPLGDVVGRFARTHGPFRIGDVVTELGLPAGVIQTALLRLEQARRVARGAFRPGTEGQEWVDLEVLRRLKRRSLAALRHEIEPVEPHGLGRFLPSWHGLIDGPARGRNAAVDIIGTLQGADIPASVFEADVMASRLVDHENLFDQLAAEGEVVWVGRGALGTRDGRIAVYFRDQLPVLSGPAHGDRPEGPIHDAIRLHLDTRGASFFRDLYGSAGGGDPGAVLDALWDLVWAGEVSNDTFAPLRSFLAATGRSKTPRRPTVATTFPAHSAGRWSAVSQLICETPDPTTRAAAIVDQLLRRHGVLTRSAVAAEAVPGGFAGLYPVLSRLEETGRVRRGYFIEGLGGAQFALPGAVDRLRIPGGDHRVLALAATDPANPYGAALEWPATSAGRIGRIAGAHVLLHDGRLAGFVDGRRLLTFGEPDPDGVAEALAAIGRRHRRYTVETVDGETVSTSQLADALRRQGFTAVPKGLRFHAGR